MHRHTKIRVIAVLIGALVLVPVIPAVADAMAGSKDVAPMHAMQQKSNSSQVHQGCAGLICVSHDTCASQVQCSVSCSATIGIFDYTFGVRNHTGSTTLVSAIHAYTLVTLASDDRPPIIFG